MIVSLVLHTRTERAACQISGQRPAMHTYLNTAMGQNCSTEKYGPSECLVVTFETWVQS